MLMVSSLAAVAVAMGLVGLAGLHVYWGFGGPWPARTAGELGPMVVGTAPGSAMPGLAACLVVAALLVTAAGLVVWAGLGDGVGPVGWVARVGSAGVAGVLALRGLGGYADGWLRPESRVQPYYALNRRIYSPLCLVLAGLIAVVLG